MEEIDALLQAALADLDARHVRRQRRSLHVIDSTHVEIDGQRYVNFASNNYLGLSHHPAVCAAARDAIGRNGFGSGAASLVTGHTDEHAAAERALADWKGVEDAVLLPSGFQANQAAVGAIAQVFSAKGVRFLMDKLVHASLVDAVRATGAPFRVFPHNGIPKLRRLLDEAPAGQIQVVVTESTFSMDGDAADLIAIAALKRERPFVLLLDEAHATGVYGDHGQGLSAGLADVSVVTLSKALGGIGGAVCGSNLWCEAVVNNARAYLFSTSLPPAVAAATVAAIGICRDEPWRREKVKDLARRVRTRAALSGDSPIIPIIIGDENNALAAAERLRKRGLLVPAIRPPTVPRGTSRLRVTVNCDHTDAEIESLLASLF